MRSIELTVRDIVTAVVVAAMVGALFPYIILRLGFGPNISLIATLLASFLFPALRPGAGTSKRLALHAAQAAGVAAGQIAFMGGALLAFELVRRHGGEDVAAPKASVLFVWLASAGTLGVLLAMPLRDHYLANEKLTFAGGQAAGEAILAVEQETRPSPLLFLATLTASLAMSASPSLPIRPVALGSGLLVPLRVALSLTLGTVASLLLSYLSRGAISENLRVWPSLGLMLGFGATAMLAPSPAMVRFGSSSSAQTPRSPLRVAAALAAAVALSLADVALGMPIWLTVLSIAVSLPLLLVGTRVLGETNWAPVACLGAAAQLVIAPFVHGCPMTLLVGSSVAAAIPNGGQHMMQSLRAADIVRARPEETLIAQLIGVFVGALALSTSFGPLVSQFGVGRGGLSSPLSTSWAGLALLFADGPLSLPREAMISGVVGLLIGGMLALTEQRAAPWLPSATAVGMGILIPTPVVVSLLMGSTLATLLRRHARAFFEEHRVPGAAGLILGEALLASGQALLAVTAQSQG